MEKARDSPSVAVGESQKQKGGHERGTEKEKQSPPLMDICHQKNAELEPQFQRYCEG